jgi:hypothetical protein
VGTAAVIALLLGAILIGGLRLVIRPPRLLIAPALVAAGALLGALASQRLAFLLPWRWTWAGLHVVPALLGGLVAASLVEIILRCIPTQPVAASGDWME